LTFKDLKRVVSETAQQQQQSRLSQRLHGKPFWIWNKEEHKLEDIKTDGDCCFNHIIGLPSKEGVEKQCLIMKKYCTIPFWLMMFHTITPNFNNRWSRLWD
jgi:hypothetical protein